MKITKALISLVCIFVCCSCSHPSFVQQDYLACYKKGRLSNAESMLVENLPYTMQEDHYLSSKDAALWLLDRATIRFANGDIQGAILDYQHAIEAIDFNNQLSPTESLIQVALQDDISAYAGEDFEQILARVYFALVLLLDGDENNALALLRQAEEVQQQKREIYHQDRLTHDYELVDNALAKYLMAALLEHQGDPSNAEILYQQTEDLIGRSLHELQLRNQSTDPQYATVVILAHNGNSPYKISGIASASLASALALEILLKNCEIQPAYSSMTGIPVPVLMQQLLGQGGVISTRLCRQEKDLFPLYNITATAAAQLQQKMPLIVARGLIRFAIRRSTVAILNEQDPCLGALADMGMLVANACTVADTRSWGTLPNTLDIARYDIPPGEHTLHLLVNWGLVKPFIQEYPLKLQPHDFCVINIFNINPGIVTVQIPNKNKLKKDYFYDSSINATNTPIYTDDDSFDQL